MDARGWWVCAGMLLAMGCGSGTGGSTRRAVDAGPVDTGTGQCQCLPLALIEAGSWLLCECPVIQYGCETAPQSFQRVCDLGPGCWSVVTDLATGCPMPALELGSSKPTCNCLAASVDAGVRD
jgi:hypothetical protein